MKSEAAAALAAMRKPQRYRCGNCAVEFESVAPNARYCSSTCRQRARAERNRDYRDVNCATCGTDIYTADTRVKYCSVKCRRAQEALS